MSREAIENQSIISIFSSDSDPATSTFLIGFVKANPVFCFCGSIRIPPATPLSAAIRKRPVKADGCNGVAHMAVSVRSQYSSAGEGRKRLMWLERRCAPWEFLPPTHVFCVWRTFYSRIRRAGKALCHVGGVIA